MLLVCARLVRRRTAGDGLNPRVSVLLAVYNEEQVIEKRIRNLLDTDYKKELTEIIVASDGSDDRTVELALKYENVKVLEFGRQGRAFTHNSAMRYINSPIIIFTDGDTEFDRSFIGNIVNHFSSGKTGCVVGNLIYRTKGSSISESEGIYWEFEKRLRHFESDLGILATATGACMAVRRELWKDLTPIDDSDFTTPLDVIMQGYGVVYAPDAVAYDEPPSSVKGELSARIRQTSKNLSGTLNRWRWKGWVIHPFVSLGILSHKLLRWFTPFFMLAVFVSSLFLLHKGFIYRAAFITQAAFYLLALTGFLGELARKRVPLGSPAFSFCVANIGMGLGVIKGLAGKAPAAYKTTE